VGLCFEAVWVFYDMKNYVIALLLTVILVLGSLVYKNSQVPVNRFPIPDEVVKEGVEVPFYLFVFFSQRNCRDCMGIIEVLNVLPEYFVVTGLVPERELANEAELRGITGAQFPLLSNKGFKRYFPFLAPTVVGVSPRGDVIITLPGITGKDFNKCSEEFFLSLYNKVYPILLEMTLPKQ